MKSKICFGVSLAIIISVFAFKSSNAADTDTAKAAQIKHGQYIVERVGMCGDCHTPKTDTGDYDRTSWLQGDVLDFKPTHPIPGFALVAPQIAGLPTLATDELAIRFFETGTNAVGKLAAPPMPRIRLEHDDAVAVTAYLRSLKK
jgi:mono/diheme cytochrome c family protein